MATSRRERRRITRILDRVATATLGTLLGLVAGIWTMIALFVAKAQLGSYIYALDEITDLRPELLIVLLGVTTGAVLGYHGWRSLGHGAFNAAVGLALGAFIGGFLGHFAGDPPEGKWAGGIIGSAVVMFGALAWVILLPPREARATRANTHARVRRAVIGLGLIAALFLLLEWSDPPAPEFPETDPVALPDPANVYEVVFLMGDGGATLKDRTPLLLDLQRNIERWSMALASDSAVSLLLLGDNVYPAGVHDRSHPLFLRDSTRLFNQIYLVSGPRATRNSSVAFFLAGNHDWGNNTGQEGLERLRNMEELLENAKAAGFNVAMLPPAGSPGPVVRDPGNKVRIIFLDIHWFLQDRSALERSAFFDRVEEALRTAGDRHVIIAAHHPYRSAGPHGSLFPGARAAGLHFLLKASGTLVQDLNSEVYSELHSGLDSIFVRSAVPPLIFTGGHDHSLQVIVAEHPWEPSYSLVSGAGSKVSPITQAPGLRFGASRPGYMMLAFRKDGAVDLLVRAGDPDYLTCSSADAVRAAHCMKAGTESFTTVYSTILLSPEHPGPLDGP